MRKEFLPICLTLWFSIVNIGCSSNPNDMSNSNILKNNPDDKLKWPSKEQFISKGKYGIREDSVTELIIRGNNQQWKLGNYIHLRSIQIEDCSAPLSFDFIKNSECINYISISFCKDIPSLKIPFQELTNLKTL